jgi:hypothetical protein
MPYEMDPYSVDVIDVWAYPSESSSSSFEWFVCIVALNFRLWIGNTYKYTLHVRWRSMVLMFECYILFVFLDGLSSSSFLCVQGSTWILNFVGYVHLSIWLWISSSLLLFKTRTIIKGLSKMHPFVPNHPNLAQEG